MVPGGQKLVLFGTHISLLDDGNTILGLVGLGMGKSGRAGVREERQVGRPGGRGRAHTHLAEGVRCARRVGGQIELRTFGGRTGSGPGVHELVRGVHGIVERRTVGPGNKKVSDSSRTMRSKRWLDSIVSPASVFQQKEKNRVHTFRDILTISAF